MWIELHDSAREHPKVIKLARALGVARVYVLGLICSLWLWTLRMAPDGDLSSFEPDDIEIGAQWEGTPGAFVAAALDLRLLDKTDYGLCIHDWAEFSGSLKTAKRVRDHRERKRAEARTEGTNDAVTVTQRYNDDVKRYVTQNDRTTERPKEREGQQDPTDHRMAEAQTALARFYPSTCQAIADELVADYPAIDVAHCIREAHRWEQDNPSKAKSNKTRYLRNWLKREAGGFPESVNKPQPIAAPPPSEPDPQHKALENLCAEFGADTPNRNEAAAILATADLPTLRPILDRLTSGGLQRCSVATIADAARGVS